MMNLARLVEGIGIFGGTSWGAWTLVRRRLHQRRAAQDCLRHVRQMLTLDQVRIVHFPVPALGARYLGYPITLECRAAPDGWRWRLHSELQSAWEGRLLIHGEDRPGRMRELYGMEIVLTGDAEFDRMALIACTDEARAAHIFSRYLRERYRQLAHTHFQLEVRDTHVYAECTTQGQSLTPVPIYLDLVVATMALLETTL